MVADDGELGYVPSEKLHEAFQSGFRWQTQADRDMGFELGQEEIRRKAADDQALSAFAGGALNTVTLGGVDAGIRLGEEAGLLPEGVTQVRADQKEMNPVANVLGSVAGAFVPLPLPKGLGGSTSVAKVGEGIAAKVGGLVSKAPALKGGLQGAQQLTKAQAAIRGIGATALGSAAEGAFYGIGESISEAAIGDPEDIVGNLAAGITFGGLTGGGFGAAFGGARVAKPFLMSAGEKAITAGGKAAGWTARQTVGKIGKAALSVTENAQIAKDYGDLVDDLPFRNLVQDHGIDSPEVRKYVKGIATDKAALEKESRGLVKALNKELDTAEVGVRQRVLDEMGAYEQDLNRAREGLYENTLKPAGQAFDDMTRTMDGPAQTVDDWLPQVRAKIAEMRASGYPALEAKADEVEAFVNARTRSTADDGMPAALSQGEELQTLKYIKQSITDKRSLSKAGIVGEQYGIVKDLQDIARDALYMYPDTHIGDSWRAFDQSYNAYKILEDVSKEYKGMTFFHPEALRAVAPALGRVEALAPEIERVRLAMGDTRAYGEAMSVLLSKARQESGAALNDPVAIAAFTDAVEAIVAKGKPTADRLKQISSALSDTTLTPMEQAVRFRKLVGKDTTTLEKFLPYQRQMDAYERVRQVGKGDAAQGNKTVAATIVGTMLGGPVGGVVGNIAVQAASSPAQLLHVLTSVERAANKGAQKLTKAMNRVSDAVVSGKVQRAATIGTIKAQSMAEKREQYTKVMKAVGRLMTPEGAVEAMEHLGGNTQGLNRIKTAASLRLQNAALYLDQMAPKDPMAGSSVLVKSSGWQPSDVELSTYMRRVAVVNDPTVAIDNLADGSITLEEMDALKTVHPDIYQRLQANVFEALAGKTDTDIPYSTRLLLGTMFGVPTDYSMTPAFIGKMQAPYTPQDQGGRPDGSGDSGPRKKNIDISPLESMQSDSDKITYRDAT